MDNNHDQFLVYVFEYVKKFPEVMPLMIQILTAGIEARLQEDSQWRVSIEAALAMSLMRRSKKNNKLLAEKLTEIKDKTSLFNFESVIEELNNG